MVRSAGRSTAWCLALIAVAVGALLMLRRGPSSGRGGGDDAVLVEVGARRGAPSLRGADEAGRRPTQARPPGAEDEPGSAPPSPEEEQPLAAPATVVVRVLGWGLRPVARAQVRLWEPMAPERGIEPVLTDAEGRASIPGVGWPAFEVEVSAAEYFDVFKQPERYLTAGESRLLEVVLTRSVTVRGRVVRAEDGGAIEGARVRWRDTTLAQLHASEACGQYFETSDPVTTDAGGRFALAGLRAGVEYSAWIDASGREQGERRLYVATADRPPELLFVLGRAGRCVARVRDSAGAPVAGMRITLVPEDLGGVRLTPEQEVQSDAPIAPAGDALEAALNTDISLAPGSWFMPNTDPIYSARTGDDGVAVITGLRLGRAFSVAEQSGDVEDDRILQRGGARWVDGASRVIATAEHPEVLLELAALHDARLRLRILDPDGVPIQAGATMIRVSVGRVSVPDPVGVVLLRPGKTSFRVSAEGYPAAEGEVTLASGEEKTVDVRLERGVSLRGVLTDGDGRPFTRAWIVPVSPWQPGVAAHPDGAFSVEGLEEGPVRLSLLADEALGSHDVEVRAPAVGLKLTLPRVSRVPVVARLAWPAGDAVGPDDGAQWTLKRVGDARSFVDDWEDRDAGRCWYVAPGEYELSCEHGGCTVLRRRITIEAGSPVDLGVVTPLLSPAVEGRIVLPDGTPVPHARVVLVGYATIDADEEGRFHLAHGPLERGQAVIGRGGLVATARELDPPVPGQPWRIVGSLGALLEGEVAGTTDPDALRLDVEPRTPEARSPRSVPVLDSAGRFRLRLAPGGYRVTVRRGGEALAHADVLLDEASPTSVTLRLPD